MSGAIRAISELLGARRTLVRRVGALCLVFIGVHAAADAIDEVLYDVLDALDLIADDLAANVLPWLADAGGLAPDDAARHAESFATWIDLEGKARAALVLALAAELAVDLLLLPLAWGLHVTWDRSGLAALRPSGALLVQTLRPLDVERVLVVPALALFAGAGACVAGLAVEGVAEEGLRLLSTDAVWTAQAAAFLALVAAALLVVRFVPDMVQGALLASRSRHDVASRDASQRAREAGHFPRMARWIAPVRLGMRGLLVAAVVLPLACAAIGTPEIRGVLERVAGAPE